MNQKIDPPWVKYPEHEPFDPIYNRELEPYFHHLWRPFFDKMSQEERAAYLQEYPPTKQWRDWIENKDEINWLLEDD